MEAKLQALRERLYEINDIGSAAALLYWDQATYMPPRGAEARARQRATLSRLAHERWTDPAIGELLDDLQPWADSLPHDADERGLLRVVRREYRRATQVPPAFVEQFSSHAALTTQRWRIARPDNNFASVRLHLDRTLELSREYAGFFPGYDHPADPLIDEDDEGLRVESLRQLFGKLRNALVPLVQAVTEKAPADDSCLRQFYPAAQQIEFGLGIIRRWGYDFDRGRQDFAPHPFMTKFSLDDVRITTRADEHDLGQALFSTLHEAGHAMYEQGIRHDFERTPLARGTSSAVHESQSRLWENIVGRSRGFWRHFYPRLQEVFPSQLGTVPLDTFYRAVNKVQRSLIRTDADELTYNLHVILRFELELDMLEGRLPIADLAEAWRARYTEYLGITPPDDRDGVLQDIHWFGGLIGGAFHGYTVGNILAAQFFDAAVRAEPGIPDEIERGESATLHGWLQQAIYQHGSKYALPELVERVTGGPLSIQPYVEYLQAKYGEMYSL